jgi:hypothetical protein
MTRRLTAILALALTAALAGAANQDEEKTEARLKKDVSFLASPACEGRGPRTEGLKKAGDYLASEFKKIGLKPAFTGGNYFQPFALAAAKAEVVLTGPKGQSIELNPGKDFYPLGIRQQGGGEGGVVFVGYGWQDAKSGYDDYEDVDVKGKVVVLLHGMPRAGTGPLPSFVRQVRLGQKLELAEKNGAIAAIVVNDNASTSDNGRIVDYSYGDLTRGKKHLPTVLLKRDSVELMMPANQKVSDLEKAIDRDGKPVSFALAGWKANIKSELDKNAIPLRNVVGVLEGSGPLADETVVVGAHYDHLGWGGPSSNDSPLKTAIHHGADDNASGTAAILELARRFASMKERQGRRIVFCAFAGEEQGLFGSKAYCDKPPFPLKTTASMFNLDMVGRLRIDDKTGKAKLLTEGHGTAKPFKDLIDNLAKKHSFVLSSKSGGYGPSDHSSFTAKDIPVLFFWTDVHADYHRPSDTADKVNYPGMRKVVELSQETVQTLTTMEKPKFIPQPVVKRGDGPRLGIRPGYSDDSPGVVAEGVLPGGPAEKGGMKDGDVIVGLAGKPVKDLASYMVIMAEQKPKTTIEVEVLRKGSKMKLKIPLE